MNFERRIFFTYAVLIVFVVTGIGTAFRIYMVRQEEEQAIQQLRIMAEKNSRQLDETIRSMKLITDYLLSDPNVLSGFSTLATLDDSTRMGMIYREQARSTVRRSLLTYGIIENFYRVTYFNDRNDFISSRFLSPTPVLAGFDFRRIPWFENARALRGRPVISGAHRDPWERDGSGEYVFSLGRAMPGFGYIEVQQPLSLIDRVLLMEEPERIIVFSAHGDVIYSHLAPEHEAFYSDVLKEHEAMLSTAIVTIVESPGGNGQEYAAIHSMAGSGVRVMLIKSRRSIVESLGPITAFTIFAALVIVLISFAYIFLVAKRLTKPIRALTHQIERIALENIDQDIPIDTTNDEIEALNTSFAQLLTRLNRAIVHEKHMSLVTMKNQIDTLNAQINPHFIYNVLNVISYHGMQSRNDDICTICSSLASILRYSTDTTTDSATIGQEVGHLREYVYLMSSRYQHKLECTIDVPRAIEQHVVPRLLLQPLVENAINHGFDSITGVMHVTVQGTARDDGWEIRIRDNGQGFSEEKLRDILLQMESVQDVIRRQERTLELKLGGMGLINSYARMLLLYRDESVFTVRNHPDGGAEIVAGGSYRLSTTGDPGQEQEVSRA